MTPAARLSAAIDVLDRILDGVPAEKMLTNWARSNRYAGSGDRSAIRDHVYDALRCLRSFAHLGGGKTGRGLILGQLRAQGIDPTTLFTGEGYAPAPLSAVECQAPLPMPELVALDCPDWLGPRLKQDLGSAFEPILKALQNRACVFLRANTRRVTRDAAIAALGREGIVGVASGLSPTAIEVRKGARRIAQSDSYKTGLVELQDAASQAITDLVPIDAGQKVLDYCAGGGGKSLALAARARITSFAYDHDFGRMKDIEARSARAGVSIKPLTAADVLPNAPFDVVLVDAPCSGSGSWRRTPEAKWALTPARLDELGRIQAEILEKAAKLVSPKGVFAYATCSVLVQENAGQIENFLARTPDWSCVEQRTLTPCDGGDGFFVAILKRV